IDIHNLKVLTCHGVLPEEKVNRQPFYFDVSMEYDFAKATKTDDLALTLNYDEIMHKISDFCKDNTFDLIETLCHRTALMLMRNYPIIGVSVTVKKPQAPVSLQFDYVSVNTTLTRNTVLLSLGSNMGERQSYLDTAIKRLGEHEDITIQKISSPYENAPYGGVAKLPFINMAVKISTYLSPYELLDYLHLIESEAQRDRSIRWGDRTLDIDIVFYGDKVIDDDILTIPHPDYQNRDFVLIPLKEIAPDFLCPICRKRIRQLQENTK
ncbi:MAG: 2-amino-4-hydroxy-6-hydroxymethyldihydropteridine diphosphokinase, partial [Clostridia bacterium]|nr:2-amino-4-hydroxy-6-hydroxymethyldihydropteridine diphosphokinase [Clostridia bacterium]